MTEQQATAFVTLETEADLVKRQNLYFVSAFIGFVWMLFHFTVVFFFTLILKSPVLVGVFLGFGNLVALVIDVPVSILGRYFAPRKLYVFAAFSMLGAGLIFLKFIYASSLLPVGGTGIVTLLAQFLDSTANIALLALAACFYGFTKEVNDLTTLSYILNNSDPSEYSSIISRNNIYAGAGALLGLLASGFVLSFSPTAAIVTLNIMILILIGFIFIYFDSAERTITLADVTRLKVIGQKMSVDSIRTYATGYLEKTDFAKLAAEAKLIFLRPQIVESGFNPKNLIPATLQEFERIKLVLTWIPLSPSLFWFMALILAFGFWDTFAASFLIDYLSKLPNIGGFAYALLGAIAIPAFVAQDFFIKLAARAGKLVVALIGLWLSGASLICFGLFDGVAFALVFGLINSLGYAAGMWLVQGGFLELYNLHYAKKQNLSEIDSNASASPMKIIQNLANVLGLTLGGLLLAILGYSGFFIAFGLLLVGLFIFSMIHRARLSEI
jgi:hypothetical protein